MIGLNIELVVIAISLFFLFFFSLVENAIVHSSPLVLRMMTERPDIPNHPLLSVVLENRMQVLVPLQFGIQISVITIAVLTTHVSLRAGSTQGMIYSFAAIVLKILISIPQHF